MAHVAKLGKRWRQHYHTQRHVTGCLSHGLQASSRSRFQPYNLAQRHEHQRTISTGEPGQ
eukprot:8980567-Alexandrium_andersonii.AAC.1